MGKDWLDQKLAGSLQSGVVALLSKKASAWTRRWPGMEVVVVMGAVLILFYEWRKMGMNLKISWLGSKVAQGLILNTVLGMVGQGGAWVSTVNALVCTCCYPARGPGGGPGWRWWSWWGRC